MASRNLEKIEMLSYIAIPVREDHLAEVHKLLAELERRSGPRDSVNSEGEEATELHEDLVRTMYKDSEDRHRKLLKVLAGNAGKWITMEELATALGASRKEMAGTFGAFGRRARHRYRGKRPWTVDWQSEQEENAYRMRPDVAAWVNRIAAELE